MSDTTITPETRRMFVEDANSILAHDKNLERRAAAEAILRLIAALEVAEGRAEELKADIDAGAKDYCALMDRHDAQFVRAEEAESQLRKAEEYGDELESQLQDAESEYNANWAVQAITDVAHLVDVLEQCQGTGDDIGEATLEAVQDLKAENARLTAQLAALTGQQEDCKLHPCPYSREGLNCGVISLANNRAYEGMIENTRLRAEMKDMIGVLEHIQEGRPGGVYFQKFEGGINVALRAARRAVAGEGE